MRSIGLALFTFITAMTLPLAAKVPGERFTSFAGFKLNKTNLGQIQNKLGATELVETGDAGEYEASICYRTPEGFIRFMSGEMGGREHELLGFDLGDTTGSRHCTTLPEGKLPGNLEISGLRIGMTDAQFKRLLGVKIRWNHDTGSTRFEGRLPMNKTEKAAFLSDPEQQDYFDVTISIEGIFKDHRLVHFNVWKIESY